MRGWLVWTLWATALPAQMPTITGVWRWTCCGGRFSGTWQINRQEPDGTFAGRFSERSPEDVGAIEGKLDGERIGFLRRGTAGGQPFEQRWSGVLSADRITGTLDFGDFSAERISEGANLLGEWRWTCCGRQFSGTWRVGVQRLDGYFSGEFGGRNPYDVGTIEGKVQGNKFVFTRRGVFEGRGFEQRWTGIVDGNTLKGTSEGGDFFAETGPERAPPKPPPVATGGGICFDPQTLAVMDEWLKLAVPPQDPGDSLRYDAWGRVVGTTRSGTIQYVNPPETRLARCDWLWFHSPDLRSVNGLGSLRDYVDLKRQ